MATLKCRNSTAPGRGRNPSTGWGTSPIRGEGALDSGGRDYPGLRKAVHIDGTLNDDSDRDRGWTVELALPWSGLEILAQGDGRALPPKNGDVWRMDFSRFNMHKEAPPSKDSGGWAWSAHGVWDSHVPECFTYVEFSEEE